LYTFPNRHVNIYLLKMFIIKPKIKGSISKHLNGETFEHFVSFLWQFTFFFLKTYTPFFKAYDRAFLFTSAFKFLQLQLKSRKFWNQKRVYQFRSHLHHQFLYHACLWSCFIHQSTTALEPAWLRDVLHLAIKI
jgi:hypothetical protein